MTVTLTAVGAVVAAPLVMLWYVHATNALLVVSAGVVLIIGVVATGRLARAMLEGAYPPPVAGEGGTPPKDRSDDAGGASAMAGPGVGRCYWCGDQVGLYCWRCCRLRAAGHKWPVALAAFIVRRWTAVVLILATSYAPLLIAVVREDELKGEVAAKEKIQKAEDAAARSRLTAQKLSESWAAFRAPLISLGAQCGALAGRREPFSAGCDELLARVVQGYAQVSWYLPEFVIDLREGGCAKQARQEDRLVKEACKALGTNGNLISESAVAFRTFVNAYASYTRSRDRASELANALKDFYDESRRLGCALSFAEVAALPLPAGVLAPHQIGGVSPFCEAFLGDPAVKEISPLEIATWFDATAAAAGPVHAGGRVKRSRLGLAARAARAR